MVIDEIIDKLPNLDEFIKKIVHDPDLPLMVIQRVEIIEKGKSRFLAYVAGKLRNKDLIYNVSAYEKYQHLYFPYSTYKKIKIREIEGYNLLPLDDWLFEGE
ncbi:MAG TPA: hypothetical protein VJJ23_03155 [Candidatus Nanoarchaeia archaeon]|nr:hypothetical protein [Candidatus Nanoarchaeia archaeon]